MNCRFLPELVSLVITGAFLVTTMHDPFFWDAVQLGSKHAHFFYNNNLQWALLPTAMDSGHPPTLGYYLAMVWTWFGKTIPVSHMAIWPFVLGTALLSAALGRHPTGTRWAYWLVPMVLLDPVFMGQAAGLGPDTLLLCFWLLAIWGILTSRKAAILLGILGLCLISMRGMMASAALACWIAYRHLMLHQGRFRHLFYDLVKQSFVMLPGALAGAVFLWWHYKEAGWIGHHPDSPWKQAFVPLGPQGWLRNTAILGWRFLDLGRWAEWLVLGALLVRQWDAIRKSELWILLLISVVFMCPSAIFYQNISAHRYFLPVFAALHLLVVWGLVKTPMPDRKRILIFAGLCVSLAFGNRWIYPTGVSMTWDSTLAHRPYHSLRAEMIRFIDERNIPFDQIGSAFPNINTGENLLLNGDQRIFSEIDWKHNQYIVSSNVFNDIQAADHQRLASEWKLIHSIHASGVWMKLYQKQQ